MESTVHTSYVYLDRLRTADGKPITYDRVGSISLDMGLCLQSVHIVHIQDIKLPEGAGFLLRILLSGSVCIPENHMTFGGNFGL